MISKERLRKLKYPLLIAFFGLWLLTYILTRIFLEMYTDATPSAVWTTLFIIFIPLSAYTALRSAFAQGGKWYHSIGYFFIFTVFGMFVGHFIVLKGDMLFSSFLEPPATIEVKVLKVKKVIKRKLGFDHTAVTLQLNGKPVTMEARAYTYFYLEGKSTLKIATGTSFLGNTYVLHDGAANQEKRSARWLHIKDWAYRLRWLWIIMLCLTAGTIVKVIYFPVDPAAPPSKPIGFWKLLGIVMAILIGIALLLYTALLVYVTFFVSR
jgi:hypothetical protein